MTTSTVSAYVARPITFLELWRTDGWRLKVYGIADGRPAPRRELVEAAKRLALAVLPAASGDNLPAVGFVGAHDARGGCYVFVDWWADENELHHRAFLGSSPDELRPIGLDDAIGCVWDLAVIDFERRAWLEAILKNPELPDLEAYLERRLEAVV